jgi:hypothetical protein
MQSASQGNSRTIRRRNTRRRNTRRRNTRRRNTRRRNTSRRNTRRRNTRRRNTRRRTVHRTNKNLNTQEGQVVAQHGGSSRAERLLRSVRDTAGGSRGGVVGNINCDVCGNGRTRARKYGSFYVCYETQECAGIQTKINNSYENYRRFILKYEELSKNISNIQGVLTRPNNPPGAGLADYLTVEKPDKDDKWEKLFPLLVNPQLKPETHIVFHTDMDKDLGASAAHKRMVLTRSEFGGKYLEFHAPGNIPDFDQNNLRSLTTVPFSLSSLNIKLYDPTAAGPDADLEEKMMKDTMDIYSAGLNLAKRLGIKRRFNSSGLLHARNLVRTSPAAANPDVEVGGKIPAIIQLPMKHLTQDDYEKNELKAENAVVTNTDFNAAVATPRAAGEGLTEDEKKSVWEAFMKFDVRYSFFPNGRDDSSLVLRQESQEGVRAAAALAIGRTQFAHHNKWKKYFTPPARLAAPPGQEGDFNVDQGSALAALNAKNNIYLSEIQALVKATQDSNQQGVSKLTKALVGNTEFKGDPIEDAINVQQMKHNLNGMRERCNDDLTGSRPATVLDPNPDKYIQADDKYNYVADAAGAADPTKLIDICKAEDITAMLDGIVGVLDNLAFYANGGNAADPTIVADLAAGGPIGRLQNLNLNPNPAVGIVPHVVEIIKDSINSLKLFSVTVRSLERGNNSDKLNELIFDRLFNDGINFGKLGQVVTPGGRAAEVPAAFDDGLAPINTAHLVAGNLPGCAADIAAADAEQDAGVNTDITAYKGTINAGPGAIINP